MCFGVKILNFVYFGVKKSGISVFLVSAENGAGVNKKTNITYTDELTPVGGDESLTLSVCPSSLQHLLSCGKILAPYEY